MKVVSEIHDPVTTTNELIPSGETSSYRSNPLGLAEFALSRKDPAYVGRAKEVQESTESNRSRRMSVRGIGRIKTGYGKIQEKYPEAGKGNIRSEVRSLQ